MECDIKRIVNLNISRLPIKVSSNEEYETDLPQKLKEFLSNIKGSYLNENITLVNEFEKCCDIVEQSFLELKKGNDEKAEGYLKEYLNAFLKDAFLVSELDKSYAFRGVAPLKRLWSAGYENEYEKNLATELTFFRTRTRGKKDGKEIAELKDIVHIPYSLKSKATDMRFSRKEKPCLYLGTTSWICAKECQWDECKEELFGAVFVPTPEGKKLKILNLTISQSLINGIQHYETSKDNIIRQELLKSIAKIYPLVLAISYTIKDQSRPIKYEYLISQCLMDIIHDIGIDGVAYLSAQGEDEFQYPQGVNLALPAYDIIEEKQFSMYCSMFSICKPQKYKKNATSTEKSFINMEYKDPLSYTSKITDNKKEVFYVDTEFSSFDNYLCSQEKMVFDE